MLQIRGALVPPPSRRQVGLLHAHRIVHHDLGGWSVVVDEGDQPWLVDFDASEAMAGSPGLANDVAELLVSLARIVGTRRALAGALAGLGTRGRWRSLGAE